MDGVVAIPLAPEEQGFVDNYCEHYNLRRTAKELRPDLASKYRWATEMVKRPAVANAIAERQKAATIKSELDETWVLQHLKGIIEHSTKSLEQETTRSDTSAIRNANTALELVGRHLGMWQPDSNANNIMVMVNDEKLR